MARRYPPFLRLPLERKIKPAVEFLLDTGVAHKDMPLIPYRCPASCNYSINENLRPKMQFLEDLGVDKAQWGRVVYRYPRLLGFSKQQIKATVDHLSELGMSAENIGKISTKGPNIVACSVGGKLRPAEEYFPSSGMDVATLWPSLRIWGMQGSEKFQSHKNAKFW